MPSARARALSNARARAAMEQPTEEGGRRQRLILLTAGSTDAKKEDDAMKVIAKKMDAQKEDLTQGMWGVPMPRAPLRPGQPGFRHGTFSMPSSEFDVLEDSEYKRKAAAERERKKEVDDFAMKVNARMTDAKKEDATMKDAKKTDAKMEDDAMMED